MDDIDPPRENLKKSGPEFELCVKLYFILFGSKGIIATKKSDLEELFRLPSSYLIQHVVHLRGFSFLEETLLCEVSNKNLP